LFPFLGWTYHAAVMSDGFMGIAIGTTPIAMATMTAVTQRYGALIRRSW
jgi:ESS family glutamate:Na+ symporter